MIEKNIHQVWVGDFLKPLREQELMKNIENIHPDFTYYLWTSIEQIQNVPPSIISCYERFYKRKDFVFCADLLRLLAVFEYGGIYLDVDWAINTSFSSLFDSKLKGILFHHGTGDYTIPNNIFALTKNSDLLSVILNEITPDNNWFGPSWFGQVIKKYYNVPYIYSTELLRPILQNDNIMFYGYNAFEKQYGKHMSLYSWEPKKWNRLVKGEQL